MSFFWLKPVPPFRLDLTVWTLRRRADNVIDRWDGTSYRRVLALPAGPAEVTVTQSGPRLRVALTGDAPRAIVTAALERLLGLDVDLTGFYALAADDARLGPLMRRFRGMKPPRYVSVFEGIVNAIAGQQVTLTLCVQLCNRLAVRYGPAVGASFGFPRPADLAGLDPETLRELGFSRQKGRALIELAQASAGLEDLATLPDELALDRLRAMRGVGRWTAEYALLRCLGRVHVFPGDDVGARNNLQRWLHLPGPLDYAAVERTLARWHPYGGLIYFHLLLDRLAEAGHVQAGPAHTAASDGT